MSWRAFRFGLFFLVAMLGLQSPARGAEQADAMTVYTVRSGDNLFSLATRYFNKVPDYREVQRLNNIADPYRISVGTRIRIPTRILRQLRIAGAVVSARGQTLVVSARSRRPLSVGDRVSEGDRIVTGPNSFVTLRLEDGTLVNLPSQSITAVRTLRKTLLTGRVERRFWLEEGRINASVQKLLDAQSFRIDTPVSVSAVRGTEYRVSFDKDKRKASTEVLEGIVAVQGADKRPPAAAQIGEGVIVRPAGVEPVRALLAAPEILSMLNRPSGDISLTLAPVEGAVLYHAQIGADERLIDTVAEAWSEDGELMLVPDGATPKYVRVSVIDADGMEGLWATQQLPPPDDANFAIRKNGHFGKLAGASNGLRIQIMAERPDGPIVIDRYGTSVDAVGVTGLANGTYYWRAMDETAPSRGWSESRKIVISRQE